MIGVAHAQHHRGVGNARIRHRAGGRRDLVIGAHGVGQAEHGKGHQRQKNGQNQTEALVLEAGGAHFERVLHRQTGADELGLLGVVLLQLVIGLVVGRFKDRGPATLRDPGGRTEFFVHAGVSGEDEILFVVFEIGVDHFHIRGGQLIAALDLQNVGTDAVNALAHTGGGHLVLSHIRDDTAVGKLNDPVGIALGKIAVVGNNKHQFLPGKRLQGVKDLLAGVGIQRAGRLVGHDDLRLLDQCAGNGHALFLAAGQLVGLPVGKGKQIHLREDLVDLVRGRFFALQFQRQRDIRADRKLIQHVVFLEDEADEGVPVGVKIRSAEILGRLALDDKLARIVAVQPADDIEQGGFAAARFTQDKHHARFRERNAHIVQCLDRFAGLGAVGLGDVPYLQHSY